MSDKLRRLARSWYVFAIWLVVAVVVWLWIVSLIIKPSDQETLGVFVCSEVCDQEELVSNLQAVRPDYIKQFEFKWVSTYDDMFSTYYQAFAVDSGDIIVMPESKLSDYSPAQYLKLDEELTDNIFGSRFEYLTGDDGSAYGIKIDAEKSLGEQPSGFDESYYLLFNVNSLHLGRLNGSEYDGAIEMARVFL